MSVTLSIPAYDVARETLTLRQPENFNIDSVPNRVHIKRMADGSLRTYTRVISSRIFDMTFNLYCKRATSGISGMLEAVQFFYEYNGDYIKYVDSNSVAWTLQILDQQVTIDQVGPNHWQFSITGERFPRGEEGSGAEDGGVPPVYVPTI